MKILTLILFAAPLFAQYAPVPTTSYSALSAILNAKPAATSGAGAPSGNCTTGLDLYLNTAAGLPGFCTATNTWTSLGSAALQASSAFDASGAAAAAQAASLQKSSNLSDIANPATARANLGVATIDRLFLTGMNGSVGASSLNLNTSGSPAPGVVFGTNSMVGVLTFTTGVAQTGWGSFPIPAAVPTSLVAEIKWRTADTGAHNVVWNWNYVCSPTSIDAALSSAGTVTTSNPGTGNQVTTSTITLSSPSCSAGDQFYFSLVNRGDTETATSNIDLISLRIHN